MKLNLKSATVGDIRSMLAGIPDDTEVNVWEVGRNVVEEVELEVYDTVSGTEVDINVG